MLIKKMKLKNFRQFKGETIIDFAAEMQQNVTVVMGENGSGKTTLAQAFVWGLYGVCDFKVKELLNRDVRDDMEIGDKECVEVALWVNVEEKDYRIVRRESFYRGYKNVDRKENKFFVEYQDEALHQTQYMTEQNSKSFVKKMLPQELSRFFFFDGERIRVMSDEVENGRSKEFANAVHGLVGLRAMMNAREHFDPKKKGTVVRSYQDAIDEQGGKKYSDYTRRLDEINEEREKHQKRIDEISPRIKKYREEAVELKVKIKNMSSAVKLREEYENMEKKAGELQNQKNKEINNLLMRFSSGAKYFFRMPLVKDTLEGFRGIEHSKESIPKLRKETVTYLLKRKKCICGEDFCEGDEHCQELYRVLELISRKNPAQVISDYVKCAETDTRIVEGFYRDFVTNVKHIEIINQEIEELQIKIKETEEELIDTSEARNLEEQRVNCEDMAGKLENEKRTLEKRIGALEHEEGYVQKERDNYIIRDENNKRNRRFLEYARLIYEQMDYEYKERESSTREELERTINGIFAEIYEAGIQLSIDERYNIRVSVNDSMAGDELERNTAQNYAIIFAFISGIIKMSKDRRKELNELYGIKQSDSEERTAGYPLVMDAPLSAFDKRRIESICHTIPDIAQQVIIFIKDTDGTVAEEYMDSRIGAKYLLVQDSQTETHVERR